MTDHPGTEPASARIPPERAITAGADVPHTGSMLGAQYAGLLVAAQGGDEGAFATLWRDANPALSRYLRVVTAGIASVDAGDIARESWRTAIHRLADFEGDETAWRSLLFTAAHARVEVARIGRSWGDLLPGEGLALDELSGSDDTPVDQLAAPDAAPGDSGGDGWLAPVLTLPRGEAQVLMLAVAGELPDAEIARVVGSSVSAVRDLQEAALAHLGSDRESVAQALSAPGTPAELADEELAVAALRATTAVDHLAAALATRSAARGQEPRPKTAAPKHVIVLRSAASRAAAAVVATALVGFGAVSEAAYSGALPDGFQDVMHEVIGAPTPTERLAGKGHTAAHAQRPTTTGTTGTSAATSSGRTSTLSETTSTVSPVGTTPAVAALCRAWAVDQQAGKAAADSAAYRALAAAVGGGSGVAALCERVTATTNTTVTATATPTTQPTSPVPSPVPSTTIPTEPTTPPTTDTPTTPPTDTTTTTPAVPESTTTTVPDTTTTTVPDTTTTTTPTPETTTTTTPDPETTTTPAPETTTKHEPETTTSAPATTTPAAQTSTTQAPETTTRPISQTTTTPVSQTTTPTSDTTTTAPGKTPSPVKTTQPPATTSAPASGTPAPRNAKRHREDKSERTKARRHKNEHSKGGKHRRR